MAPRVAPRCVFLDCWWLWCRICRGAPRSPSQDCPRRALQNHQKLERRPVLSHQPPVGLHRLRMPSLNERLDCKSPLQIRPPLTLQTPSLPVEACTHRLRCQNPVFCRPRRHPPPGCRRNPDRPINRWITTFLCQSYWQQIPRCTEWVGPTASHGHRGHQQRHQPAPGIRRHISS